MYQALLTRRYLTSKVMPLLAALAVTLCTAMVLIVWSVMGGFLVMLMESGRTLIGDVSISSPGNGFAHYADLIKRLEADERVEAATPMIEGYGLLQLPLSSGPETVVIKGVDGPSFERVTGYRSTLWWRPLEKPLPKDAKGDDPRLSPDRKEEFAKWLEQGAALTSPSKSGEPVGAVVLGVELGGYNNRQVEGWYSPTYFLPGDTATLSVLPLDRRGRVIPDQATKVLPIANHFRSGLYDIDANTVLVRLDVLQKLLKMDATTAIEPGARGSSITTRDPATGRETFSRPAATRQVPARITHVLVRAKPGTDSDALRERCKQIYREFALAHDKAIDPPPMEGTGVRILTWRDRNMTLIAAVEKETYLVLFIFGIISLTAVFLVLAIFWAMVSEKTRDIGILRAIGAGRLGVAWLWLRYGLAIGVVGSLLGGTAAILIITNINPIHDWMGRNLQLTVWDPRVYYFNEIPNDIEPLKATIVLVGGVLASVAGALVPAIKAARMDPIRALRFE
ncbi:MAG: ABC transporter permease [Phycisphaerales bacterium]